jgi:hypothetical protein
MGKTQRLATDSNRLPAILTIATPVIAQARGSTCLRAGQGQKIPEGFLLKSPFGALQ